MSRSPVELIKERLSIIDVVSSYVELHKAGKHYKGKSPFTNEKTPSFFVAPDRGVYFCFSSQKGGDIFTFIQEMEGVDFKGALKILAERANVELIPEDPKKRDAREQQYALLEEATAFFFRNREEHSTVTQYVTDRGVTPKTMHSWRIGYALDEWRSLRVHLTRKGFTDEEMLRAGLVKRAEGGKEPYDVFRDRVMFPIADPSGRIIAFSGRTLKQETGVPKYVNSPETELFQKSETLYGYDKAKQHIRQYDFSLIVEGQFDVVLAHQAGYTNTVAVSGTALTPHHIMLLSRLSSRVVMALDADRAGISAVKRSAVPLLSHGMDVKVARLPEGKDPADVIRGDPPQFKQIVRDATHVVEFMLQVQKRGARDDRAYKLNVREELLPLVAVIQNRIDREHFEGVVASAIDTTKDSIHYEVERLMGEAESQTHSSYEVSGQHTPPDVQTRAQALVRYLSAVIETLPQEQSWLRDEINSHLSRLKHPDEIHMLTKADDPHYARVVFSTEEALHGMRERDLLEDISEKLTELSHLSARAQLATLRVEMRRAEEAGDDTKLFEHLRATKVAEAELQRVIRVEKPVST